MSVLSPTHDQFKAKLVQAQKDRPRRGDIVVDPVTGQSEIAWMLHERQMMLDLVNEYRRQHGREPAMMAEVVQLETIASGHIDYTNKWAWYCAHLAVLPGQAGSNRHVRL